MLGLDAPAVQFIGREILQIGCDDIGVALDGCGEHVAVIGVGLRMPISRSKSVMSASRACAFI